MPGPKKASRKKAAKQKTPEKPKGKPTSPGKTAASADFEGAFQGLRKVLAAYAPKLKVATDRPGKYEMVTRSNSWRGGPMFFGAVMLGKAYVSCHLMALYMYPELKKAVPPELMKHMQGKACFNFRAPDEVLFRQLANVARVVFEKYRDEKWL